MAEIIYSNNDVKIEAETANSFEKKINVNGENLIWISNDTLSEFKKELIELLDKHRI